MRRLLRTWLVPTSVLTLALGLADCAKVAPTPAAAPAARADAGRCGTLAELLQAVQERAAAAARGRTIRLAVIPLRQTESPRYRDAGFGSYLTERVSSTLGAPGGPVRLFERERLDAVLQEQKLSLSGLFGETEARRIGELAPIDFILTGTFTRLDRCAAVNLRFIDVVTGEVAGNLAATVDLGPDLANLFVDAQAPAAAAPPAPREAAETDPEQLCRERWNPVRAAMKDIGTPERLDALVGAAVAIPFEPPCGNIHYEVMAFLRRYHQAPARYGAFLLRTLQGMDDPDEDDRAGSISRYFLASGALDDPAWNALVRLASRSRRPESYFRDLLADPAPAAASRARLQARIGILLDLAARNQFGRPVPRKPQEQFDGILEALRSDYLSSYGGTRDARPLLDAYRTYAPRFAGDDDKRLLESLVSLHDGCDPGPDRALVLGWFAERVNRCSPGKEVAEPVRSLMERLFRVRAKSGKPDAQALAAGQELDQLAAQCGPALARTIPFEVGRDYVLDLQALCLSHGVPAPGLVPTPEELVARLGAEGEDGPGDTIRLLTALGPRALPAEPGALKLLRRTERGSGQDMYVRRDLVLLLGSMGVRDPEAIQGVLRCLEEQDSYLADAAVAALVRIGEPAALALKAEFARLEEPYRQIRVVQVFQQRGHDARPHLPWLKARLAEARSPYVRDALEDAVAAVE